MSAGSVSAVKHGCDAAPVYPTARRQDKRMKNEICGFICHAIVGFVCSGGDKLSCFFLDFSGGTLRVAKQRFDVTFFFAGLAPRCNDGGQARQDVGFRPWVFDFA